MMYQRAMKISFERSGEGQQLLDDPAEDRVDSEEEQRQQHHHDGDHDRGRHRLLTRRPDDLRCFGADLADEFAGAGLGHGFACGPFLNDVPSAMGSAPPRLGAGRAGAAPMSEDPRALSRAPAPRQERAGARARSRYPASVSAASTMASQIWASPAAAIRASGSRKVRSTATASSTCSLHAASTSGPAEADSPSMLALSRAPARTRAIRSTAGVVETGIASSPLAR